MAGTKVAVIYYSSTGNTAKLAEAIGEGAREAGSEVRVRRVAELAPEAAIAQNPAWKTFHEAMKDQPTAALDDLEWADAIVLGSPSRFGMCASQLKQFIDMTGGLWFQGKLANKVVSSFCTASNAHGGQEAVILSLNNTFYHWGAIVVGPGYTDPAVAAGGGNPYGTSATNDPGDNEVAAARYQGKRVATIAQWVAVGKGARV